MNMHSPRDSKQTHRKMYPDTSGVLNPLPPFERRARFTIRPYPAPESALRYGRNIQPAVDVSNLHLPPDRYILIKPVSHRCPSKHQRRDVEIYVDTARDKIAARRFGAARSPPNICFPPLPPRAFLWR